MKTLAELQRTLTDFEASHWDASCDEPGYARHTLEHLAKLMGKMGNAVEPCEHGLEPDTTPPKIR